MHLLRRAASPRVGPTDNRISLAGFEVSLIGRIEGVPRGSGGEICHTVSVSINVSKRAHVILPIELVADIDKLVGKRGRSAFLAEVARDEIMRRQQRLALQASAGAWKDEDHPELKGGSAAWVRQMRSESERRFEQIQQQHRDSE